LGASSRKAKENAGCTKKLDADVEPAQPEAQPQTIVVKT